MRKILFVLLFSSLAFSQSYLDALRPFYGYQSIQPLSSAIGHATVAAGQVIPGTTSNPANMALQRFTVTQFGFEANKFKSEDASLSRTVFNGRTMEQFYNF